MGLIATIHTTDIDQMAELVAAARSHGPIEVCYVAGGLELHRVTGDQAEPEPAEQPPAPAAKRPAAPKKTPAKPAAKATADTTCPDCGHVAASPNGLAIHRGRKHGTPGAHAHRRTPKPPTTTATPAAGGTVTTFTTDTPIARGPIDHGTVLRTGAGDMRG